MGRAGTTCLSKWPKRLQASLYQPPVELSAPANGLETGKKRILAVEQLNKANRVDDNRPVLGSESADAALDIAARMGGKSMALEIGAGCFLLASGPGDKVLLQTQHRLGDPGLALAG